MLSAVLVVVLVAHSAFAQLSSSPVPSGPNFVTIDNANTSAWTFQPGNAWGSFSGPAGNLCPACLVQPDPARAHDGTWSDTSTPAASASLKFSGVGISVFTICPGPIPNPGDPTGTPITFFSDFSFELDGVAKGGLHLPDGCSSGYVYNQLAFSATGLAHGPHTFTITNNAGNSDLLLDFAVVDVGADPTSTSTSTTATTTLTSSSSSPVTPPPGPTPTKFPSGPVPSGPTDIRIEDGDPSFIYSDGWGSFDAKHTCPSCFVRPDPARLSGGTWHETSGIAKVSLKFTGIAVSIFGACPGPIPIDGGGSATMAGNFSFTLDSKSAGSLSIPGGCTEFVYSQKIFSATGLTPGEHVVTVQNGGGSSDLILDFAVVDTGRPATTTSTPTTSTPPTSSSTPTTPPAASLPPNSPAPPTGSTIVMLDDTSAQIARKGAWGAISQSHPCPTCLVQLDFTQTFDKSYSELSQEGSATIQWSGTSIFVYGVCPGTIGTVQFIQNFAFSLDGKTAGTHASPAGGCSKNVYKQLLFSKTGLSKGAHVLVVTNVQNDAFGRSSDLILDFIAIDTAGLPQPGNATTTSQPSSTSSAPGAPTPSAPPASPKPPSGGNFFRIDDASSQIKYTGSWGRISKTAPCSGCDTLFDVSKVSESTYSELTGAGSAQLTFKGTELYVYGACSGTARSGGHYTQNFVLAIDGKPSGTFNGPAGGCSSYVYQQLLFKVSGLPASTHTASISNVLNHLPLLTSDLVIDFFVVNTAGLAQPGSTPAEIPLPTGGESSAPPPPSALSSSPSAASGGTFRQLDDTSPQIQYAGPWGAISKSAPCTACATQFDFAKLSSGTYHELSSAGGTATIRFAGTSIAVYGACPGTLKSGGQFLQRFALSVDNDPVLSFDSKGGCKANTYNQQLFSVTGLSRGQHVAVLTNLDSGFPNNPSDLVLDFVIINSGGLTQPAAPAIVSPGTPSIAPPGGLPAPSTPQASLPPPTGPDFLRLDDTSSQISYSGSWGAISKKAPCTSCQTKLDFSQTFDNSYHELSVAGTATLSFAGTEVYVYGVCPGTLEAGGQYLQSFTFTVDDQPSEAFNGPAGGCAKNSYNQLLFKGALTSGIHNLTITNIAGNQQNPSDLILDYVVINTAGLVQPAGSNSTSSDSTEDPSSARPSSGTFVDDTDSRWTFTGPVGAVSASLPCANCLVQPDPSLAYGQTWRDLSGSGSATLTFIGSDSASVFVICPGPLTGANAGSFFRGVFNVSLDGQEHPQWTAPEHGCSQTLYNVMVASFTGLDPTTQHELTLTNVIVEGQPTSDLMLDYALLNEISPSNPSDTSPPNSQQTAPPDNSAVAILPSSLFLTCVTVALLFA